MRDSGPPPFDRIWARAPDKDVDKRRRRRPSREPAGKVEVDSRGNSVWRWARDVIESTSVLLKRLENKDLALEPTQKVPIMRAASARRRNCKGAGDGSRRAGDIGEGRKHPALREERGKGTAAGSIPYNSR